MRVRGDQGGGAHGGYGKGRFGGISHAGLCVRERVGTNRATISSATKRKRGNLKPKSNQIEPN